VIIGLSHIIFSTNDIEKKINNLKSEGYELKFLKKKIKNNKEKFYFMFHKNKYHDIYFLHKKGKYNIEFINYFDTLKGPDRLTLSKNIINLHIPYPKLEKIMFKKFLFVKDNLIIKNDAISKSLNFLIRLKKKKIIGTNYLDREGMNTIAFFCKDILSLRNFFIKIKLKCTKIFSVSLFDNSYKIFIVKSKNKIFYEFLEIV